VGWGVAHTQGEKDRAKMTRTQNEDSGKELRQGHKLKEEYFRKKRKRGGRNVYNGGKLNSPLNPIFVRLEGQMFGGTGEGSGDMKGVEKHVLGQKRVIKRYDNSGGVLD